jgi:hypothetical protein
LSVFCWIKVSVHKEIDGSDEESVIGDRSFLASMATVAGVFCDDYEEFSGT